MVLLCRGSVLHSYCIRSVHTAFVMGYRQKTMRYHQPRSSRGADIYKSCIFVFCLNIRKFNLCKNHCRKNKTATTQLAARQMFMQNNPSSDN